MRVNHEYEWSKATIWSEVIITGFTDFYPTTLKTAGRVGGMKACISPTQSRAMTTHYLILMYFIHSINIDCQFFSYKFTTGLSMVCFQICNINQKIIKWRSDSSATKALTWYIQFAVRYINTKYDCADILFMSESIALAQLWRSGNLSRVRDIWAVV